MALKAERRGAVTRFDLARSILGRGRYFTTCYLVDGLMIDTGCPHCVRELLAALGDEPVRFIVNTHTHEDHIGANAVLQQATADLEIRAHPLALPVLADPRGRQPLHPYRRVMWGWPEPSLGRPLEDGEVVETATHRFQVIYTPGHAPDHLCLFEPDRRWLFTGDLYVGGRDRALRAGYDIWQIIDSLKRVAALAPAVIYPGSARIPDDPATALAAKIDHLEGFGERVLELDRQGRSVSDIVRALCGGAMWIELITLGHFSRRNLVLSYLCRNGDQESVKH